MKSRKVWNIMMSVAWFIVGTSNLIEGDISRMDYALVWAMLMIYVIMELIDSILGD